MWFLKFRLSPWRISGLKSEVLSTFSWCKLLFIYIYMYLSFFLSAKRNQFQFRLQFWFRFQTQSVVENLVQRRCHSFASNCFVYPASQTISISFGWTLSVSFALPGSVLEQLKRAGENESRSSRRQLQLFFQLAFHLLKFVFLFCVSAFHSSWCCSLFFALFGQQIVARTSLLVRATWNVTQKCGKNSLQFNESVNSFFMGLFVSQRQNKFVGLEMSLLQKQRKIQLFYSINT